MIDQDSINAMKKVMANLGKVEAQSLGTYTKDELIGNDGQITESRKFTDPNVHAMHDILSKLSTVTTQTKRQISEEVKTNTKLRQFTEMEQTGASVKLNKYEINIRQEQFGATSKNVYDITNTSTGQVLYEGLALFESVMIITKHLLRNGSAAFQACDRVVDMDQQYSRYLSEASTYKARIKKGASGEQLGIYESKYSRAIAEAKAAKSNILKS